MTTVAWDGRTLAADRAAWSGNFKYQVRKVYAVRAPNGRRCAIAFSGDGGFAMAVLAWLRGGEHPGPYPEALNGGPRAVALLVRDDGRTWKLDTSLRWTPTSGRLQASGGGQDMAMGAMAAGASAVEAIRIVARHSDLSGCGVSSVRLR